MITSCAPTPFMRSNNPSPSRSSPPSIPSAGNLFGTTRMLHPAVFAEPPLRPYTRISDGVFPSLPGQNGQFFGLFATTLSRKKSFGRFPRSVEIITQRPVIGSFRNSGKAFLLEGVRHRKQLRPQKVDLRRHGLAAPLAFPIVTLSARHARSSGERIRRTYPKLHFAD